MALLKAPFVSSQIQAIRTGGGRRMRKLSLAGMKAAVTDHACAALADASPPGPAHDSRP
jgi:hypothetical protein